MRILTNKQYREMEDEIARLELELNASQKNNHHKENMMKVMEKNILKYKETICNLKIQLEDKNGFLNQEKKVSNALRKERESYKKNTAKHTTRNNTKKEEK